MSPCFNGRAHTSHHGRRAPSRAMAFPIAIRHLACPRCAAAAAAAGTNDGCRLQRSHGLQRAWDVRGGSWGLRLRRRLDRRQLQRPRPWSSANARSASVHDQHFIVGRQRCARPGDRHTTCSSLRCAQAACTRLATQASAWVLSVFRLLLWRACFERALASPATSIF